MPIEDRSDYRLRWLDFDRYGRIKPIAVLDMMQDVAITSANRLGIGHDVLDDKGVFWVIIRTKLEIMRNPENSEIVSVRTWPHTLTSFSFLRDFELSTPDGGVFAKATTEWVLVNAETRKFASARDYCENFDDLSEERAFEKKPRKVANFAIEGEPVRIITPSYSDIDVNGHVNNAVYANYVVDTLDPGEDEDLLTVQIDYRYEVRPGHPVAMYTHRDEDEKRVRMKGVDEEGVVAFAAEVAFRA